MSATVCGYCGSIDGGHTLACQSIHKDGQKPRQVSSEEHGVKVLYHALVVADGACRSDIECYAYWIGRAHQPDCYDLTKSNDDDHPLAHSTDKAKDVVMAQNAARYIDLRGDALPFRMVRDPSNPQLVHFEEKQ